MFKKLFGQAPATPGAPGTSTAANQTINAMQSLAEREEQLEKKKLLLEKRINDEMEKAREFTRQKKKSQALMCLKKKKMYEQQLERMDALISRVMEQRNMLEEQQTTIGVLGAMQDAAKAQKKTMQARRRRHARPHTHTHARTRARAAQHERPALPCAHARMHAIMHACLHTLHAHTRNAALACLAAAIALTPSRPAPRLPPPPAASASPVPHAPHRRR